MGNCCMPQGGGQGEDQRKRPYVQMKQQETWAKTGIVGLREQGIKELPAALVDCGASLRVIDASHNRITSLPSFLATLGGLQRLVLAGNALSGCGLPPGACTGLASLKILVLDDNQLSDLPPDLGSLTKLEKLSVAGNRLRELPGSVGQLETLQFLILARNLLEQLPDQLSGCARLEELDAQGNELAVLPPSLGDLKKLKTLNVDNNKVLSVPQEILFGCVSLQTLSLHGCPIKPDDLQETPGFKEFDERRKSKYNKVIAGGALLGNKGLDEGVDREVSPPRR
ncbi:hypothetical protein HYH03_003556 [Edaphochlamys debaryana]|uniref:Uncharacterized protein n=1 Tax=Edaphochlamys debaryana TaxID=47281 RepID=A0A836C311_9CHLO|nr:hypothetical protein HYH03_003556 [Edaphochlamys debaryana]|eukprot:KAG2498295.1 hypothetical protein HYH03_003556 [Edaphochlamys debaryana]